MPAKKVIMPAVYPQPLTAPSPVYYPIKRKRKRRQRYNSQPGSNLGQFGSFKVNL